MSAGQVKLFGTIQLTNFANIYSGGKINGLSGDSLGKSANAQVNGSPAFITEANSIVQGNTPEDCCANSPSTYYTNQLNGSPLGGNYIFDNASGFTQQGLAGQYFRKDGDVDSFILGDFSPRSGYYELVFSNRCA